MFENKPKFKETIWESHAFSLKVDLGILCQQSLPVLNSSQEYQK
jgi:hypothetical protein